MKKFLAFLLIVSVSLSSVYYFKSKKGERVVPVETAVVKRGEVKRVIDATGIIKPQVGAEIKVGARISGTVVKENVKVGDYVKKGDLIAVIDNRELREELKKAKAKLEEVKKTYPKRIKAKELRLESALAELRSAEAKLKAKEENYRLKKWELERQEELFKRGYTTEQKLRKARFDLRQAGAI